MLIESEKIESKSTRTFSLGKQRHGKETVVITIWRPDKHCFLLLGEGYEKFHDMPDGTIGQGYIKCEATGKYFQYEVLVLH